MAKKIHYTPATQLNFGNIVQCDFIVSENGVNETQSTYTFNPNFLSCAYDSLSPNQVTLHLGYQHSINLSNGLYDEFYIGATSYANATALAAAIVTDLSTYAIMQVNP
jgi:hypothetical protein